MKHKAARPKTSRLAGPSRAFLGILALISCVAGAFSLAPAIQASEAAAAEEAAWSLAKPLEKDGYVFRAESWLRDLAPDVGKAVRIQLFKGHEYSFCIAAPPKSGARLTAVVLDFEGDKSGKIQAVEEEWGLVLTFKPRKTGVYAVAIRQTEQSKGRTVPCALLTGYK